MQNINAILCLPVSYSFSITIWNSRKNLPRLCMGRQYCFFQAKRRYLPGKSVLRTYTKNGFLQTKF